MAEASRAWSQAVGRRAGTGTYRRAIIGRVPFAARRGVIGLAIAGSSEHDGHPPRWQGAAGGGRVTGRRHRAAPDYLTDKFRYSLTIDENFFGNYGPAQRRFELQLAGA
jgi:hypothetical protein